jgi:hypothetical protein
MICSFCGSLAVDDGEALRSFGAGGAGIRYLLLRPTLSHPDNLFAERLEWLFDLEIAGTATFVEGLA